MNKEEKTAAVQALLFYYGEPIAVGKAAKLLGMKEEECASVVEALSAKLNDDPSSGFVLLRNGDEIELATKPSLAWIFKKLIEEEFKEELTPAALETISIVAYLGPVTRAVIDYVRGVNSTFILRNLLIRGLVSRNLAAGKKNVFEYRVSFDFLKHMGVARVEDLPEYQKYKNILQKFEHFEGTEENHGNQEEIIPGSSEL